MNLPTGEMSVVKDCNGYYWQVQDHYWYSTRRAYRHARYYVVEPEYGAGPVEFERNFGPFTIVESYEFTA
jgi:hypothetical protein